MFRKNPVTLEGLDVFFERERILLRASTNDHKLTNAYIERFLADNEYPNIHFFKGAQIG